MKSGLDFLVAARQCEIAELEQLARTGELVGAIGRLTHALQKERGMSNVFLGTHGLRFGEERQRQVAECEAHAQQARRILDALDTNAQPVRNGARLFSRIAYVLQALDGLPALRQRIATQALSPEESTAAFVRLVAGLLAVVFEAADSATDPGISRALVALFNFMQGKEFAGQERAFGAARFAEGRTDAVQQQQWQHLIAAQDACFHVFADHAHASAVAAWRASLPDAGQAELERLRRIGCAPGTIGVLHTNLSQTWYGCCTRRIDAMKTVEDLLTADLRRLCERKIAQARAELQDQKTILDALLREAADGAAADAPSPSIGPKLERSILGMVQEQSRRLQAMSDELETVRAALHERKVVERAKGLLMASRKLGEEEAFKMLRQTAMNQNRRLVEVAESVLAMAEFL